MPHGLDNCQPVLRRWAAHSEAPLPADMAAFKRSNFPEWNRIATADPELIQLLDGSSSAGLRADALGGKLSPIPPDPQKRAAEERQARISELTATNPFGGQG